MMLRSGWPWLTAAAYLVVILAVVQGLFQARRWAVDVLGTPEAQRQWQKWRVAEQRRAEEAGAPVRRRPPASAEPPLLVVLRDGFVGVVVGSVVIVSVLFAFLAFIVLGLRRQERRPERA